MIYEVEYSRGWSFYTFRFFSKFVVKTKNFYMPDLHFKKFTVMLLWDFVK